MANRIETVQSFAKGLEVLLSFGRERRRQTITDVAENTAMTRAAARRFLHTLCEQGLARTDGKHFELTPAVLAIGNCYLSGVTELETIRDVIHELTHEFDESASAAMLDDTDIIYVARSPARHRVISVGLAIGTRLPAHATSTGQALLAQLSHNELERYFASARLQRFTEATLTTKDALKDRLKLVRERGYAIVSDELEPGLRSIALSLSGRGRMRYALNVSSHAARLSAEQMIATFLPALRRAQQQIELASDR